MKNIPEKIYLQIGSDCDHYVDFNRLVGVTWNKYRINKNDVEYVRADLLKWNKVENPPICYQSGDWDGMKSDMVLVKTKDDFCTTAVAYGGRLDGFKFLDFYDSNGYEIENVTEWKPIN